MATKVITTTQVTKNLQHGFYQANGVKDTPALLNTIIYIFSNNCFTWAIKRALLRLIPYVNLKLCFKSNWKYIEFDTDFSLWWNVLFEICTTYRLHRVDFSKVLGCHSPLNAAERKFMVVFQESVNGLEWCGNDNQNCSALDRISTKTFETQNMSSKIRIFYFYHFRLSLALSMKNYHLSWTRYLTKAKLF